MYSNQLGNAQEQERDGSKATRREKEWVVLSVAVVAVGCRLAGLWLRVIRLASVLVLVVSGLRTLLPPL